MNAKTSVLVAHPWMARGGSEAAAMWTVEALQDDYDVTFVSASVDSWADLNHAYGTKVDPEKIETRLAPRLPFATSELKLVALQKRYFEKFCQKIAPDFDLCVSAYNPIDFGRPGIQLIGDFSFSEEMRRKLYIHSERQFHHRENFVRKLYLALANWIGGGPKRPLAERGDLVVANSEWTRELLAEDFSVTESPILYPPVILPFIEDFQEIEKRPLSFVSLGRISPEKEIEKMIEILSRVRDEHDHPVTFSILGHFDQSDYSREIRALAASQADWITPHGFLAADEKQRLLAEHEFAIHGCRIEAFGIAVAEMASLGALPVVPASGGAREIVGFEELHYRAVDEAAKKISDLIENPWRTAELRETVAREVHRFGPESFSRRLRELAADFTDAKRDRKTDASKTHPTPV
ncbi:MAG: glycosyltransferase family 4 protein [Verrucomicrobiales bacterium]|nr:glycosyltransferase family 4 protein [Verrucomicrobiales bacterium]